MGKILGRLWRDETGATSIEYSLIAAFIGLAIITVLQSVGTEVKGPFIDAETGLKKRQL